MNSMRDCGTLERLRRPSAAVGVAERAIRGVGTALGIWTRNARLGACTKAAAEATAGVMSYTTSPSIEAGWVEVIPSPKMLRASNREQ